MSLIYPNDGRIIELNEMDVQVVYNLDGTINYMQFTNDGRTYVKTVIYSNGGIAINTTRWELQ